MDSLVGEPISDNISKAPDIQHLVATSGTVAPAGVILPATTRSSTGVELFQWERFQLTQQTLTNLTNMNLTDAAVFKFSGSSSIEPSQCKVFPGDAEWPSPSTWNVLNLSTGGVLLETVPLAAPCYSNWPQYNTTACEFVTNQWGDPHFQ